MIERKKLVNKVLKYKDKKIIKVITGVRRSGKSTLFDLAINEIISTGIEPLQIFRYNFEDPSFENLLSWKLLYDDIKNRIDPIRMNYIFLDEIQEVDEFERVVNGLMLLQNVDIYLTGSNAYFLSSELATKLTGRYVEILVQPLSFSEYVGVFGDKEPIKLFNEYMTNGGFPQLIEFQKSGISANEDYLQGIYNTVIMKDVLQRVGIADKSKLYDITRFLFDSIGSLTSYRSIADIMTSAGRKISNHTAELYISALVNAFLFYKVERYDLKGKRILSSGCKYYCVDAGLRRYALGKSANTDLGHVLENIVFLELLRRNKYVWIGKANEHEIDFAAETFSGNTQYYQVAYSVREEKTLARELCPLEKIKDFNRRFIITADYDPVASYNGIERINAIDWLLDDRFEE